jgi:hypothetical protein
MDAEELTFIRLTNRQADQFVHGDVAGIPGLIYQAGGKCECFRFWLRPSRARWS